MDAAISPYDLSARSLAAMAGLLLADTAVTLLPAPLEGSGAEFIERAMLSSPRFLQFMDSWRWTQGLWHAGVLVAGLDGQTPLPDVHEICEHIRIDSRFAPIRRVLGIDIFASTSVYLDAVCRDLLHGGVAPGVSIPVSAGLERFAARHDLTLIRTDSSSLSSKLERKMERRLFQIPIPILESADDEALLTVRRLLSDVLGGLRAAIARVVDAGLDGASASELAELVEFAIRPAARRYSEEFVDLTTAHAELREMIGKRSMAALIGSLAPSDSVLRAAGAAAGRLGRNDPDKPTRNPAGREGMLPALPDVVGLSIRRLPWDVDDLGGGASGPGVVR